MNQTYVEISLTKGHVTLVSIDDVSLICQSKWQACVCDGQIYAKQTYYDAEGKKRSRFMHRVIAGVTAGHVRVDHKNHNTLDNRRHNLRVCYNRDNSANSRPRKGTSKFKGVSFSGTRGKWVAQIMRNGRGYFLGYYEDEKDAAVAYNEAAKTLFGEFAFLNEV